MTAMDFSIGFVIYCPEPSFIVRMKKIVDQGYSVCVFDNSPWKSETRDYCFENKVNYYTVGKNVGLGYGMSSLCAQSYYRGGSALLFFDQDTIFSDETLEFISKCLRANMSWIEECSAVVFGAKLEAQEGSEIIFNKVDLAINSGSLFMLENLSRIGWHNEKYFVDSVDYDFCLRSKRAGMIVLECKSTPGFDHVSEQADRKYRFLGNVFSLRAYPIFRVFDSIKTSAGLILSALYHREFLFALRLTRILLGYVVFQVFARIMSSLER